MALVHPYREKPEAYHNERATSTYSCHGVFTFEFTANSDPRRNLSDQSQARTFKLTSSNCKKKIANFLTDGHSCRLSYFAGKEA